MKIHLHIGTHKTGTSAIQTLASRDRKFLLEHGIYTPMPDGQGLPRGVMTEVAVMLKRGRYAEVKAFFDQWVAEAEQASARLLFVSSEEFSTAAHSHVEALARMLEPYDTQVILYLRNVHEFAISLCGELIKKPGGGRRYDKLVHNVTRRLNYTQLVSNWETAFGAEGLDLRCYDLERNALIETFYAGLGVPEDALCDLVANRSFLKNKSIDMATQMMLSAAGINSDMKMLGRSNDMYESAFSGVSFTPPRLPDIARMFCRPEFLDFSHARLAPFVELLSRPIPEVEISGEMQAEYLERLGIFALGLAAERRGRRPWTERLRMFLKAGRAATRTPQKPRRTGKR